MTQTLRDFAMRELAAIFEEYGEPVDSRSQAVERRMCRLVATGQVPDDILETMPEVSRHNHPQDSPQEHECGCVTITRITDRDYRHNEEPFEMRLAIPCAGTAWAQAARAALKLANRREHLVVNRELIERRLASGAS